MSDNFHLLGDAPAKPELPDSRVSSTNRSTFCGPVGIMAHVYCANCGCHGGAVTDEWAEEIFYLCDDCVFKCGPSVPGAVQIPEEVVRGEKSDPIWDSVLQAANS